MNSKNNYNINLDTRIWLLLAKEKWFNQTLCQVNESVVRLGILQGEFHWHKHDEEDEFFFVLQGKLLIDLESETICLGPPSKDTPSRRTSGIAPGHQKKLWF